MEVPARPVEKGSSQGLLWAPSRVNVGFRGLGLGSTGLGV